MGWKLAPTLRHALSDFGTCILRACARWHATPPPKMLSSMRADPAAPTGARAQPEYPSLLYPFTLT
eukprot:6194319-Pleurochrysis_carterae.AAC.1